MLLLRRLPMKGMPSFVYSAEAQAFFDRLATEPATDRKLLYDTAITSLVNSGMWSLIDALYFFAAADEATALTNLVSSSYSATAVNSPLFTADRGYTGASTKYVKSNFNPTTATSPKFTRDSGTIAGWSRTSAASGGPLVADLAGANVTYLTGNGNGNMFASVNGSLFAKASADGSGLWTASRTASNLTTAYKGKTSFQTDTQASVAPPNAGIGFLSNGATPSTGQIAVGLIASGLTAQNVSDLYDALLPYLQGVGAA